MKLEADYKKLFRKMQEEGRVINLSRAWKYNFDHQLAMKLAPIKEEFYRKERASRHYANELESITVEI